jgi:hypothetical protein
MEYNIPIVKEQEEKQKMRSGQMKREMIAEQVDNLRLDLMLERNDASALETYKIRAYAELLVLVLYDSLDSDLVSIVEDYLLGSENWKSRKKNLIFIAQKN